MSSPATSELWRLLRLLLLVVLLLLLALLLLALFLGVVVFRSFRSFLPCKCYTQHTYTNKQQAEGIEQWTPIL